jgi:hypothetical protein
MQDHEHTERTRRHAHRYLFTAKHHGGGGQYDARWIVTEQEEFAVFDGADERDLLDEDRNLYGALRDDVESLRHLGTYQEQIAEFPCTAEGMPWHGYPMWAINQEGPSRRRNPRHRPARAVFDRMVEVGLINAAMRKRLMAGGHV